MTDGVDLPTASSRMINAEKKGGQSITVTARAEGGRTQVTVLVGDAG